MNAKKPSVSEVKKENESRKEKKLKAIIIVLASLLAVSIAVVLAVFVIKPAIEKKKAGEEQTTSSVSYIEDEEYGEYMGCRMPAEFANILIQSDEESEAACKEYGVAAEINGHKLSVPEYEFYYYRSESDLLTRVNTSISEKGQNLTGFEPSKAPSAQNYPQTEITWSRKLMEGLETELGGDFYLFDEALKAGFVPSQERLDGVSELFEYIAMAAQKTGDLDTFISDFYFEGLTFSMFARREIIKSYADAYADSLYESKAKSYSDSFVDGIFENSPEKYKNVTVNILPIENKDSLDEATKVKNFTEFCVFAKTQVASDEFDPATHTESYKVTFEDIADYYGDTVAEWVFSSERRVGDTAVVAGAIYNCLIYMRELPEVTHSSNVICYQVDSSEFQSLDLLYESVQKTYDELGAEKMTEEAFREYLGNSDESEITVYVNNYESGLDKWIHSSERKRGDTIFYKGEDSAYIVMFIKDNPEDLFSDAIIRKDTAIDEVNKTIEENSYSLEENKTGINKSVKNAEAKYIEYYNSTKE